MPEETTKRKGMLVNRTVFKRRTLEIAKELRAHKWDRIAESFVQEGEAHLRQWIVNKVRQLPSKGKTIM